MKELALKIIKESDQLSSATYPIDPELTLLLWPAGDPAAVAALRSYISVTQDKALAAEIYSKFGAELDKPLTLPQLRTMSRKPVWIVPLTEQAKEYLSDYQQNGFWDVFCSYNGHIEGRFNFTVIAWNGNNYNKTWIAYDHEPLASALSELLDPLQSESPVITGFWKYWPGWRGNHDHRIEDATCSVCGYRHKTVYSPWDLSDYCPICHTRLRKLGAGE